MFMLMMIIYLATRVGDIGLIIDGRADPPRCCISFCISSCISICSLPLYESALVRDRLSPCVFLFVFHISVFESVFEFVFANVFVGDADGDDYIWQAMWVAFRGVR